MTALVPVQSVEVAGTVCCHAPVAVEFLALHGKADDGTIQVFKMIASKFACWKCEKLLPIDLKHLVLR